jgi:hypothetical protein
VGSWRRGVLGGGGWVEGMDERRGEGRIKAEKIYSARGGGESGCGCAWALINPSMIFFCFFQCYIFVSLV